MVPHGSHLILYYLPRPIVHDGLSAPHVMPMSPSFLWALEQAMPTRMALEAPTVQFFLLFNSKGSSSTCCSSVGFCATSMRRFVIFGVSANGHLFHDVLYMSVNPDHKSFVKKFLDTPRGTPNVRVQKNNWPERPFRANSAGVRRDNSEICPN